MTNIETLGLGIDPTLAQSGGAQFERILNELVAAADRAAKSVEGVGSSGGKITASLSAVEAAVAKIAAAEAKYQSALKERETATNAATQAQERLAAAQRAVEAQTAGGGRVKASDWVAQKNAAEAYAEAVKKVAPATAAAEAAHANLSKAQAAGITAAQKYRAEHEKLDSTFLSFAQRMRGTQSLLFDFSTFMGPAGQKLIQFANGLGMAARATEQLHNSGKMAETGMAGLFTRIAPIAAALLTLVAVVGAVATAWNFFEDSLKEGQELETTRANLTALTGSVHQAGEAYETMVGIARTTRFEIPELEKTYQGLFKFRREGENVNQTLKDLAVLAAGPGGNLTALSAALEQVERTGKVTLDTINLFGGRGGGGVDIVALLAASMHKSSQQIMDDIKNQQIGTREVQKALHEAAAEGGYFASIMNSLSDTSAQAFKRLHTDWTEVKAQFGAPIDAALAPLLDELDKRLRDLIPIAEQWGERVATGIRIVTAAVKDNKGPELFKLTFQVATDELIASIKKAFLDLFKWFATLPWHTIKDLFKGATIPDDILQGGDPYVTGASAPAAALQGQEVNEAAARAKRLRDMIDHYLAQLSKEEEGKEKGLPPASPIVTPSKNPFAGRTEVQTDADIMRDYNDQLAQLRAHLDAGTVSQREFNTRLREMQESTAKELADPGKYAAALGAWNAYENERLKKAAETEARIKAGDISLTDAFIYGLQKQAQAYGSFASQVAQLAQDMTNSFATGLSTAIGDIITGTKDAKTAFKDFAVSVLNDISRMIIKMLILKAIQMAIGYYTGGGTANASAGMPTANASGTGPYGMAGGGPIFGGSGSRDDVPIMAMAGEYMIRKDMVRQYGIENMAALNAGRARIVKGYDAGGEIEPPDIVHNPPGTVLTTTPSWMRPMPWNPDAPRPVNRDVGNYSTSSHLFADDSYSPRTYSPGREYPGDYGFNNPRPTPSPTVTPRPHGEPTVTVYRGVPGDHGAPMWDLANRGTVSQMPWWTNFNTSLGSNFNSNVFDLGFGTRPGTTTIGYGGTPPGLLPGEAVIDQNSVTGANVVPDPDRTQPGFVDPGSGMGPALTVPQLQNFVQNLPAGTNYGAGSIFSGFTTPAGMHVVGFDTRNGAPVYQDAHGNNYVNPGTGTPVNAGINYSSFGGVTSGQRSTLGNAAFDSHAAGLMQMAFQSFGGNPNNTGTTTDAGHTIFQAGGDWHGHAEDGVVSHVAGGFGKGPRDPRWVFPSQSVSWAGGFSYADAKHVKAYNDWLAAHNPWYYGPGGVLEQQRAAAANAVPPLQIMGGGDGGPFVGPLQGGAGGGLIVPASAFMFARRMHDGGTVGLMPGEEPIIAKRGERVVTPEQWANASPSQNTTNVFNINTTINSNGSATSSTSGRGGAGAEDTARAVNRKIQATIAEEIQPGGSIYNFVKS